MASISTTSCFHIATLVAIVGCTGATDTYPARKATAARPNTDPNLRPSRLEPFLLDGKTPTPAEAAALESLLGTLSTRDYTATDIRSRVILQNDLWGLWQRLQPNRAPAAPDDVPTTLSEAIRASVFALAATEEELEALGPVPVPGSLAALMPSATADDEMESLFPVMTHELSFDLRRMSRIFIDGNERAIISQLLAIDNNGKTHVTRIVGDLEWLKFFGDELADARVLHLDRETGELREHHSIAHIPDRGANRFFITFDPPVPISELPCVSCHDEREPNSFPGLPNKLDPRKEHFLRRASSRAPDLPD